MYIRINDLIELADWETNDRIPANEFIKWLYSNAPECKKNSTEITLSLAVSNGLRTLHEQDKIELIVQRDANRESRVRNYILLMDIQINDFLM